MSSAPQTQSKETWIDRLPDSVWAFGLFCGVIAISFLVPYVADGIAVGIVNAINSFVH